MWGIMSFGDNQWYVKNTYYHSSAMLVYLYYCNMPTSAWRARAVAPVPVKLLMSAPRFLNSARQSASVMPATSLTSNPPDHSSPPPSPRPLLRLAFPPAAAGSADCAAGAGSGANSYISCLPMRMGLVIMMRSFGTPAALDKPSTMLLTGALTRAQLV